MNMLNNTDEILGGMLSFFAIENNVCCRFIICGLYYVEVVFFYAHFLKSFHHKWEIDEETVETVADYFSGLQNHFEW